MSTDVKPSWAASRLPFVTAWWAGLHAPTRMREAPYLALLPWLITAGLVFLTASGLALAVHYNPADPFNSLQFIDRNVANGWLVHGFHRTGASMVLGAAYLFLLRGMLARSYKAPADFVWLLQVKVFALLLLIGWLGFILTGGAVAYWSLNDAGNTAGFLTGAPGALATWFFGGPNGPNTLARMAVFHIALALLIFGTIWAHTAAKRAVTPVPALRAGIGFHPYYTSQYFVALVVFSLIFAVLVFFAPHFGQSALDNLPADPLIVPSKLIFPWYLAPLAGLGAVLPGLYGPILGVVAGLGVVFALPWLDRSGPHFRPGALYRLLLIVLALDVLGLGWAASSNNPLAGIAEVVFFVWYFIHFLVLTPIVTTLEAE